MPATDLRHTRLLRTAALGLILSGGLIVAGSATGDDISQLQNKLGSTQSQLNATQTHQKALTGNVAALNSQVAAMSSQISLVQSREAAAQTQLSDYNAALSQTKFKLTLERGRLHALIGRLHHARKALAAELVSQYEQPEQTVMSIVMDSDGFNQLLSQLQYLNNAKKEEQTIIRLTQAARQQAEIATKKILSLQLADQRAADAASTQTDALAGMSSLLASRQAALSDERAAQSTALAAAQAKGAQLQSAIRQIEQREAAAQQATQTVTGASGGLGASASWAIPYPIVLCESGGQNLPPNGAGASGYYQIIPSTWRRFGGTGPAAYQASKADQDAVAARIWNGGGGASNWACSSIVGIS